ncbi:MAG: MCE family protein [Nitrospinae bacterium]|nr:MCE family protein [Nitrospinota bacterium]
MADETLDRRFRHLELKVWIYGIVSLILVAVVTAFVAYKMGLFTPTTTLVVYSPSGEGVHAGMPVKLSGFTIGRVERTELIDDPSRGAAGGGKATALVIRVTLAIDTEYMKWIRADSSAMLRKEGMVGDAIVDVRPGSHTAASLKGGDTIPFVREKSITDYVADITSAVEAIKGKAGSFLEYVNDPDGDIKQSIKEFRLLMGEFHQTRDQIATLLGNLDRHVGMVADNSSGALEQLEGTMRQTNEAMPDILAQVHDSLVKLQTVLDDLKKLSAMLAVRAPELMEKGTDAAEGGIAVTESLKNVWPLSQYVEKPAPAAATVQSDE